MFATTLGAALMIVSTSYAGVPVPPIVMEEATVQAKIIILENFEEDRQAAAGLLVEIWSAEEDKTFLKKRKGEKPSGLNLSKCPESHGAEDVSKWIGQLVSKVDDIADGLTKTAFRVEPYSASADIHIGGDESRKRQAQLSEAGARHVLTPDIIVVKSE